MVIENKQLLKQQLEQQASLIVSEDNNIELIASILVTCSALLHTAEKTMPNSFTAQEFEKVYSGYLGVASRIKQFYQLNQAYMNNKESVLLTELISSINEAERNKKELENHIAKVQKALEEIEQEIKENQNIFGAVQKNYDFKLKEQADLEEKFQEVQKKVLSLEEELKTTQVQIEQFEPNIERLIQEIAIAKDTYEEMVSYYTEIDRIQRGIQEEGFVDIVSFIEKLHEMNEQGNHLMSAYDRILKNMAMDIETLQEKIENRRLAGAGV